MEYLAYNVQHNGNHKYLYKFLYGYTNIFAYSIFTTKDYTLHNLCSMIQNKTLQLLKKTEILVELSWKKWKWLNLILWWFHKRHVHGNYSYLLYKRLYLSDPLWNDPKYVIQHVILNSTPIQDDKENVSHEVKSFFANILIKKESTILLNKSPFIQSW